MMNKPVAGSHRILAGIVWPVCIVCTDIFNIKPDRFFAFDLKGPVSDVVVYKGNQQNKEKK